MFKIFRIFIANDLPKLEDDETVQNNNANPQTSPVIEPIDSLTTLKQYSPYPPLVYETDRFCNIGKPYDNGPIMDLGFLEFTQDQYQRRVYAIEKIRERMKDKSRPGHEVCARYKRTTWFYTKRFVRFYLRDFLPISSTLCNAVLDNDLAHVMLLVARRYPINRQDLDGQSPLSIALQERNPAIVQFLINNGANIDLKDNTIMKYAPLHHAVIMGNKMAVRQLISLKADIMTQDSEGMLPLHWACMRGYLDLVGLLLVDNIYYVDKGDRYGWTPLHIAVFKGCLEIVEYLLTVVFARTDIVDIFGYTPLMYAQAEGHEHVIKRMKEIDTDEEIKSSRIKRLKEMARRIKLQQKKEEEAKEKQKEKERRKKLENEENEEEE